MDFQQVEAEYRKLKAQYDAGQLSEDELRHRVTQFTVEDDQGRWWSIGYETGQWYYHDGESWTPGTPPASTPTPIVPPAEPIRPDTKPAGVEKPEPVVTTAQPSHDGSGKRSPLLAWIAGGILIVAILAVLIPRITGGRDNTGPITRVSATPTGKVEAAIPPPATFTVQPSPTTPAVPPTATVTQPPPSLPTATPPATDLPPALPTMTSTATDRPTATPSPTQPPTATSTPPQHTGRLAFTRYGKDRRGDIYTYNLQNGQLARLTKEGENHIPRWSPGGDQIAFTSNTGSGGELFDIWTMTATGEKRTPWITTKAWDEYPAWAPDGKRLAFVSTELTDGVANAEIFATDARGNTNRLTRNQGRDEWPTWSPDGKSIAFASAQSGSMDIWIMNDDGTNQRTAAASPGDENQPAWAPDGSAIAFVLRKATEDPYGDIWLAAPDGSGRIRQLTKGQLASTPAWSPDGKWLVFSRWQDTNKDGAADRGDESDLWVLRVSDGALNPLLVAPGSDGSPHWTR